jgi:hypothetical protein
VGVDAEKVRASLDRRAHNLKSNCLEDHRLTTGRRSEHDSSGREKRRPPGGR